MGIEVCQLNTIVYEILADVGQQASCQEFPGGPGFEKHKPESLGNTCVHNHFGAGHQTRERVMDTHLKFDGQAPGFGIGSPLIVAGEISAAVGRLGDVDRCLVI